MDKNKKGFTIIGLLAAVIVLSVVVGVSAYAIKNTFFSNKEEDYESLINNISKASESYYLECVYTGKCTSTSEVSISTLVEKGYLTANYKNSQAVVNPLTNEDMSNCVITIEYLDEKLSITPKTTNSTCPKKTDFKSNSSLNVKNNTSDGNNTDANKVMYGDANDDGKVSIMDLIPMVKYVSGVTDTKINLESADVNTDGVVDDIDMAIMKKYLAGSNIKLPYNSGNAYSITYNLNGGKESSRNITKYAEISLPYTLLEPTRDGYIFAGWTGSNGNTPQKTLTITNNTTGNKNYIANWIMYGDANGDGEVNIMDVIPMVKYVSGVTGENINLNNADVNTDGVVDDIDVAIMKKYLAGSNIKLPYNSGNVYSITYNLNGGQESSRNITKYAEISLPYTLLEPVREGYIFAGWTGSNGNIPQKNLVIATGTTGNINYIANWIMYGDVNGDGEVNIMDLIPMSKYVSGVTDTKINLEAADVNTDGVVDDIDVAIMKKYLAGDNIKLPYSSGNAYSITYNLNGGKESSRNITRYAEISLPYTLLEPTRDGYVFAGWTGSNGNTPQKNLAIATGTTGNINYIANWIMYGDANGDGEVNIMDLIPMSKYVSGVTDTKINLEAADVNTDGVVDDKDVAIMKKYLAGDNIKLPYKN